MPNAVSVSVAALRNVASSAHVRAAAAPKRAARRIGRPVRPSAASTAIAPTNTSPADSHSLVSGTGWPPEGSAAMRNTARDRQTTSTDAQAAAATRWRIHTRRSASTKTSSVISTGWTTDIGPLCSARAWKMNVPPAAAHPSNHSGCRTR